MKIINNESRVVFVGAVAVCIWWAVLAGKDMNWDAINYHFYLPLSLFNDRLSQDFFPASVQSYLNPVPFIPFYLMVQAGWSSISIAVTMAVMHSINIWLLYLISRRMMPNESTVTVLLAVALGVASVLFWSQVGSSFSDITVCIPMLAALYLLSGQHREVGRRSIALAGLLLGAAIGMKMTSIPFAAAGFLAWLITNRSSFRLSNFLMMAGGGVVGALLTGGYWWWRVWYEFGNPLFPLFNNIFHSAYFPAEGVLFDRFLAEGAWGFLLQPLRLALPDAWIYTEASVPDVRIIVALLLLAALSIRILGNRRWGALRVSSPSYLIATFWFIALILWLITTGNGRYALPLFLVTGPLVVAMLTQLISSSWARVIGASIFLIQGGGQLIASEARWTSSDWGASWFDITVPQKLISEPALYLSMDTNSWSVLAGSFHPDSSFININGQFPLGLDGAAGQRIKANLARPDLAIRMLRRVELDIDIGDIPKEWIKNRNETLSRFGLKMDESDCVKVSLKLTTEQRSVLLSCGLVANPEGLAEYRRGLERIEPVLSRLERFCHAQLKPLGASAIAAGGYWSRHYMGTENTLIVDHGQVFMRKYHRLNPVYLGTLAEWSTDDVAPEVAARCFIVPR